MLTAFVGVPATGKSTIATKIYSCLKETGSKTELIVEQARQYIAENRMDNKLSPTDPIILTEEDQFKIASRQLKLERAMKYSCGVDTIVISDSSAINAFLYTSDETFESKQNFIKSLALNHYDLIFFCHTIENLSLPEDPNRIHNQNEIKLIGNRALKVLKLLKESCPNKVHELMGAMSLEHRTKDAISYAMNKQVERMLTA